jgi:imidazoleglycerol-phosphate dehydratase
MLALLALHAALDLEIRARGDLNVDEHHTVEDAGIVLGSALREAIGEKRGIQRYGSCSLPMDDALVLCALDVGGRFYYCSDYEPEREKVGGLSTEMVDHFFRSLAVELRANLHFRFLSAGHNEHHRVEAMFKAFARALRQAVSIDQKMSGSIPSTKGTLG